MTHRHLIAMILAVTAQTTSWNARCQEVFTTPTTEAIPYRIPAIATLRDGSLIAVADYRYSRGDIGSGHIDLHLRRSTDKGATWGEILKPEVMQGDGDMTPGHQKTGYGDPAIVADRRSDRVLLICCSGSPYTFQGTREHHQGMARFRSNDGGLTWSAPQYIDEETVYRIFDESGYGPITAWFIASGRILQSRYVKTGKQYRLYCAGMSFKGRETGNWVIYSDDFGETWAFLGGAKTSPMPGGDEAKCEELPDGSLLLSSRTKGGRRYNIFHFIDRKKAQGNWDVPAYSGHDNQGVEAKDNACNGELMVVPVRDRKGGRKTFLLLQSLPLGPGRTNVGIYYKALSDPSAFATPEAIAAHWDGPFQVTKLPSAYSTMTPLNDGTLGFLYEEETHCPSSGGGYTLVFRNLSIEEITDGKYCAR
ncbi:MAG: glycoside hydrolase [Bacteroidaceae bacterium]|nr:glycoside hydrolase [Bacteroidaceae bacterium]